MDAAGVWPCWDKIYPWLHLILRRPFVVSTGYTEVCGMGNLECLHSRVFIDWYVVFFNRVAYKGIGRRREDWGKGQWRLCAEAGGRCC